MTCLYFYSLFQCDTIGNKLSFCLSEVFFTIISENIELQLSKYFLSELGLLLPQVVCVSLIVALLNLTSLLFLWLILRFSLCLWSQSFYYNVFQHEFLCIYSGYGFQNRFDLILRFFTRFCEILSLSLFKHFFCPFFSFSSFLLRLQLYICSGIHYFYPLFVFSL